MNFWKVMPLHSQNTSLESAQENDQQYFSHDPEMQEMDEGEEMDEMDINQQFGGVEIINSQSPSQ